MDIPNPLRARIYSPFTGVPRTNASAAAGISPVSAAMAPAFTVVTFSRSRAPVGLDLPTLKRLVLRSQNSYVRIVRERDGHPENAAPVRFSEKTVLDERIAVQDVEIRVSRRRDSVIFPKPVVASRFGEQLEDWGCHHNPVPG